MRVKIEPFVDRYKTKYLADNAEIYKKDGKLIVSFVVVKGRKRLCTVTMKVSEGVFAIDQIGLVIRGKPTKDSIRVGLEPTPRCGTVRLWASNIEWVKPLR